MRNEFYVECYLQGSTGAVKLADLACDHTDAARVSLAHTLAGMYRPEDTDRVSLQLRQATAEDAAGVAQRLEGPLADAWRAACRGLLQ